MRMAKRLGWNRRGEGLDKGRGRRGEMRFESLEERQLLASDVATLFLPQAVAELAPKAAGNPFAPGTVSLEESATLAVQHSFVPGQLIVARYADALGTTGHGNQAETSWSRLTGIDSTIEIAKLLSHPSTTGRNIEITQLDLGARTDVVAVMRQMANSPEVLWSSPNYTYEGADPRELTPNDTQYGSQYHHPLMKNNLAWDTTLGSPSVIIGVTDDGVARSHVDLNANIWVNPGEIAGDGIDNDANGRIDDVNGWDFISNDNNPNPNGSDSHGTHVAGIAAGRTNNGIGIAGTAGGSTIMPIKFYDSANGGAWTSTVIFNSMKYGVDNGAKIISTSYNIDGFASDPTVRSALQYIHDNGRLHFNSAGNNSALNPPRQVFEQTLLVASTTENDTKSSFSNYGTGVDISSPGSNILSTVPTNAYALNSGTSMATPNAAGVAALIWSAYPNYTRDQVAATLLATADNIDAVNGAFAGLLGSGRVNSFRGVTETVAAPKVKSLIGLPAVSAPFSANINAFSVSFNQVMGGASVLDNANYELRSAGADLAFGTGDDQVLPITRTNTSYMVGTNLLNFTINGGALSSGSYRLTILSGGVVNAFGTALDGDGNGVAGADFTHEFSIDLPVFVRTGVPGGLVSASQGNLGTLASAVEVDTVPFFVDAGSKVSAVVRPTNLGATLSARIPGVTGAFTAPSPGAPVAVPATLIGAAGILGLEITGNAATGYTFDIFKNADVTGIVDDSSVVSLEGSSLPLGSQRFAAIGDSSGSPGGYAFTKYNNPGLFVDISSTGTGLGLGDDGEATVVTTVGNTLFPAGSVTIGNNGGIIAGAGQDLGFTNGAIPNSAFGNALLPFWDDIHSPAGNVYWQQQLVGGVNTLIVQWHNRPHYNNVGSGTFQLQLFASGPIAARYVYTDVDYGNASFNGGASATIGYQTSATVGSQYSQDAAVISNGDVIDISFGVPTVDVDEYSIDLTPYVGKTLDVALEGTGGLGFAGDLLEIIDPSNAVVATGTITPAGISVSNYDQGIAGFVVGTGGVHKIRVSSGHGGRYALLVTEDLVLDTEPNQSAPYRTLDNTGGALGYLAENDLYRLTLAAGQEVTLETSTPFDDPASRPLNNLDPALTVLDGASTPLASDSNSLDGKNARLNFVAPSAGEYLIRVSVESGVGEYVLHVDAATGIDGDFNDDGRFDCDDINALSTAIASGGSIATYDLNGDAALTLADQDAWRLEAGSINIGAGRPYLPGDANLDAVVDGSDFGIWNSNKFTANTNWCSGNFNADSVVDGSDFGIWNSNKFTASDAGNRLPAGLVPQAAPAAVAVEAVFADEVKQPQGVFTPSRQPLEAARTVTAIPEVNRSAISGSAVENRQARRVSRDRVFEIFGQV